MKRVDLNECLLCPLWQTQQHIICYKCEEKEEDGDKNEEKTQTTQWEKTTTFCCSFGRSVFDLNEQNC
jgi:hypothetical protein